MPNFRHIRVRRLVLLIGFVTSALLLTSLFYVEQMKPVSVSSTTDLHGGYAVEAHNIAPEFRPFNAHEKIYTYFDVCIEPTDEPIERSLAWGGYRYIQNWPVYKETQRIVVYNFKGNRTGKHTIRTSRVAYMPEARSDWDIVFTDKAIPQTHKILPNTAYFVVTNFQGNIHHFWEDEYLALYDVIKRTNRLFKGANNQILYRYPFHLLEHIHHDFRGNHTRYEDILKTLYISPFHGVFYDMPSNTCFKSAVFGTAHLGLTSVTEVTGHVLNELKISRPHNISHKFVTIIDRSNRRMLNVNDLYKALISAGINNVRLVRLEHFPSRTQAQIAATSRVMIGVQGAGLQWAAFMSSGSTLVEVAWSKRYWNSFFYMHMPKYGIRLLPIDVDSNDIFVNWTTYEREVRMGKRVPEQERKELLNKTPNSEGFHLDIWKYADVIVNISEIVQSVLRIL